MSANKGDIMEQIKIKASQLERGDYLVSWEGKPYCKIESDGPDQWGAVIIKWPDGGMTRRTIPSQQEVEIVRH